MRTRETSIDQIDGAADAFASRVRANQWAPQAERRRKSRWAPDRNRARRRRGTGRNDRHLLAGAAKRESPHRGHYAKPACHGTVSACHVESLMAALSQTGSEAVARLAEFAAKRAAKVTKPAESLIAVPQRAASSICICPNLSLTPRQPARTSPMPPNGCRCKGEPRPAEGTRTNQARKMKAARDE
jgi:hypothetical protein